MSEKPPPDASFIVLIVLAVVLLILSMFFSASESAFLSVNKLRIRFLKQKKDKKAIRIGKLLEKKDQLINTILIGNSLVNIALSSIVTAICVSWFGSSGVAVATAATAATGHGECNASTGTIVIEASLHATAFLYHFTGTALPCTLGSQSHEPSSSSLM